MSAPCPRFAFDVRVVFDETLPSQRASAIREHFVRDVVEKFSLICSDGGNGAREWLYTISREGEQATHSDRELVSAWLSRRHEIADYDVGPLVDLR
jgi:uncharacterized protein YggL (DUF469 family)